MHITILSLTPLEIIFLITSIISIILNILQRKERKSMNEPLSNTLRSLFNDIKSKENTTFLILNALFNPKNPHKSVHTLKWEYGLFAQSVLSDFQGFKEILVGALRTLNPNDIEGKHVVQASDYGLTEREKEIRHQYFEKQQEDGSKIHSDKSIPKKQKKKETANYEGEEKETGDK